MNTNILGVNVYQTSGNIVHAIQWNGFNVEEIKACTKLTLIHKNFPFSFNEILVEVGDYIVDNLTGQLYSCEKLKFESDW